MSNSGLPRTVVITILVVITLFLGYRFTREMRFFTVTKWLEKPMSVKTPDGLSGISAEVCGSCHRVIYDEWKSSMHAKAWTDPYFQKDFQYDGGQPVCLNCHTPLENQQRRLVTGHRDKDKFEPVTVPNPKFSRELQDEGITCAVCHIKDGVILGPYGVKTDAHPSKKDDRLTDGESVCDPCHNVPPDRSEIFQGASLCGTVNEVFDSSDTVNCAKCHMEKIERELVEGGPVRRGSRHYWRGGHDNKMVKRALTIELDDRSDPVSAEKKFQLRITNRGSEHKVPTGSPDRLLEISFLLKDGAGQIVKESKNYIHRVMIWRPFIIDIWDTRLKFKESADYYFSFPAPTGKSEYLLSVVVRYGLLHENRRVKIGYENEEPVLHTLFEKEVVVAPSG